MALQIAQWNIQYDLSNLATFPNLANTFIGPGASTNIILPTLNNVFVKKIHVDCIYPNVGDRIIKNYTLFSHLLNRDRLVKQNNRGTIINSISSLANRNNILYQFNKKNPCLILNELCAGFVIDTASLEINTNGLNAVSGSVSFLFTAYYEN